MNDVSRRRNLRWLIGIAGAALALALIPFAGAAVHAHSASLETVTFEDDFTTNGTDSGYIVASKQGGYYNQQGIDLKYSPGTGSPATAQAVASGQQQFGEIATSALVTAVSQGEPIKAVALVSGQDGFGVVTTASITSPQQMIGKTIAAGNPLLVPIFQAYLKAKNIDASQVHIVSVAPSALDTSVTSGSADGCLCVAFSDRLRINATISPNKTNFFPFSDVGLGFTGNVVITNNDTIKNNPDLVKRFVKATIQGWNYSFDNPNLAAGVLQALVASQSPLASAKTNVQTLKIMRKLRYTKNTKGHPNGYISVVDMGQAVKQLKLEGVLQTAPPSADALFTNQFIPGMPAGKSTK